MAKHISTGQIRQLIEIDNAGQGIGVEVQGFIRQLTSGGVAGKSNDVREAQAKRFWDLGVGSACGFGNFQAYLESICAIPAGLLKDDAEFPLLVLVETRLGLKKLCDLAGIVFDGDDEMFIAYDDRHCEFAAPAWIRVQDGRKNRNRSVSACRKSFGEGERGLTALQGVCAYLQHPTVVSEATHDEARNMDLPGSVCRSGPNFAVAFLRLRHDRPWLFWDSDVFGDLNSGSASRREF